MCRTNETQNHYEGYGWIKVKRVNPIEIAGIKYVPEQHHIDETSFLIEEIRRLAKQVDDLKSQTFDTRNYT